MSVYALVALAICLSASSFYLGYIGAKVSVVSTKDVSESPKRAHPPSTTSTAACGRRIDESNEELRKKIAMRVMNELSVLRPSDGHENTTTSSPSALFPKATSKFAAGLLRISKDALLEAYDFGVPITPETKENVDALLLYSTANSLPEDWSLRHAAVYGARGSDAAAAEAARDRKTSATANVSAALANCDTLNVIFSDSGFNRAYSQNCLTLIGDYESYHINRWGRLEPPPQNGYRDPFKMPPLNSSFPLRHIGRNVMETVGVNEFPAPPVEIEKRTGKVFEHWQGFLTFLNNVDTILTDLKHIVEPIVRNNALIIVTVNHGQSELLSNFVCSARSKNFDISNVLAFPTDLETKKLAEGLGLATYYDERNLGWLPTGEAERYGDTTFASMMFAKILCVLYGNLLGYDVLFQDVDIVWLKDPLPYFQNKSNAEIQNFDILFQHDGSPQPRFAPYSANSGFYYVRCNKKTTYLFSSLLYHADMVLFTASHQQVLVQLLSEYSSMFGLNVKVFDKLRTDLFPGGYHFHRAPDVMKSIAKGESNAKIFHMSWTTNKENKLLFFRQMGEWYLNDECIGKSVDDMPGGKTNESQGLISKCCSADPIFSCHFKDKPSKRPCPDSPFMDAKGTSFW